MSDVDDEFTAEFAAENEKALIDILEELIRKARTREIDGLFLFGLKDGAYELSSRCGTARYPDPDMILMLQEMAHDARHDYLEATLIERAVKGPPRLFVPD